MFAVSFLGFALSAGVPMRDVAVIGSLFPEEEVSDPTTDSEAPAPVVVKTDEEVVQEHLALLSLWSLDSPFQPEELGSLVNQIKARADELGRRIEDVELREQHIEDKSVALSEQHRTLEEIRGELEAYDSALRLREAEVQRDVQSDESLAEEKWAETATLFLDGDASSLTGRLQQFSPDEAARILRNLDDSRARELLDALPDEQWKTYAAAYTSSAPTR